ncbi:hypothetical protein DAPK24_055390 [Pichia kluyveri]|uniref:J domain-containing protein n=1 Tax=Pichia kluyveri TaxID=36015 RepID=A0AAV5REB3_PICKL|nr:hypothetical protein DAPK24_055390 [Pichia kluyveri]
MVKTEEDWFEEELVYEFIDIRETGNYHDKHCEFDPDKHPERRELYNMLQFAYLYLEDNKRYEEYKKTGRVVLKGLDNSVKDWKEYFETKFETAMKTMDDRLRAELSAKDHFMEFEMVWEKFQLVDGDIDELLDIIPYAKLDLETENRFYKIVEESEYTYDEIPDFEEYSENRESKIKSMLDKAAKLKKQKEEFDALNPPNYLHLVDYVEKLNQLEIPKSVVKPVIKPSAKPIVKPVIKPLAKNIPKSGLKTISAAKKVNVKEKVKVMVKKNLKSKVKVSKASKVPVKSAKKVSTVATK